MEPYGDFFGAEWWEAASAIGTLGAVIVALAIPTFDYFRNVRTRRALEAEERRKTASLVSAWVESRYKPSENGVYYIKESVLHIANESDEPVYNVHLDVAIGEPKRQIGPLSAPVPLAVLPARRERIFDISMGLLAQEETEGAINFGEPTVKLSFSDRRDVRWYRDYDGRLLEESDLKKMELMKVADNDPSQLGLLSPINPMAVAFAFYSLMVGDEFPSMHKVKELLDSNTPAWKKFGRRDLEKLRAEIQPMALPAHVWYRTERVAYVRLFEDSKIPADRSNFDPLPVEGKVMVITLVFRGGDGWKIFAFGGATSAEWIEFPHGELNGDVRSYLAAPPEDGN